MVSTLSMLFMGITLLIAIGLPIGLFVGLRKKYGLKVVPMLVGIAAFVLFALILEQIMHVLVLRPSADGIIALKSKPFLYVLYGVFAAGIFEETARFLSFHLLKRKYNGIGTAWSYGIGHGGIEAVLLVGITMVNNLFFSYLINSGMTSRLTEAGITASQLDNIINTLKDTDSIMFLLGGLERVIAVTVQIALSLVVWYAVTKKGKTWWYPVAILLHAIVDVPAALMQVGVLKNVYLVEGLTAIIALGVVFVTRTVVREDDGERLDHEDEETGDA